MLVGEAKNKIVAFYKEIQNKYWNDPVWSKVISAVIITVFGSFFTTVYLISKTIIDRISFREALNILYIYLSKTSQVNNLIILVFISVFLIVVVNSVFSLVKVIKHKFKSKTIKPEKIDLPSVPSIPTVFFEGRLADAFPGQRGIVWYNDPKVIVQRLSILFKKPLLFKVDTREQYSSKPIWWFRETSSMYIDNFEKLTNSKVLIGIQEMEVKRMAVNIDQAYYKCFIYLEVKAEKQTGLYNYSEDDISSDIETFGYSWEEYGLFKNKPIKREEYDDGSAVINGKVVNAYDAKLRSRFLTDYNFIIASHNSPFNSQKFEEGSIKYFNDILKGKIEAKRLFEFMNTFRKNER